MACATCTPGVKCHAVSAKHSVGVVFDHMVMNIITLSIWHKHTQLSLVSHICYKHIPSIARVYFLPRHWLNFNICQLHDSANWEVKRVACYAKAETFASVALMIATPLHNHLLIFLNNCMLFVVTQGIKRTVSM